MTRDPTRAGQREEFRTVLDSPLAREARTGERTQTSGCLVITEGPHAGQRFPFKDSVVLGRATAVDIRLDYASVSRRHAHIRRLPDGEFQLEDLASQNGTWVNQTRVSTAVLKVGDRIQLGSRAFLRFTLIDPAEDRLQQAQKMEAMGRLTAGISHDINNLLTALLMSSEWLRSMPTTTQLSNTEVQDCLQDIDIATKRAAELTARLGAFARSDGGERRPIDLSALCEEIVQLVRRMFPQSIELVSSIEPGLVVDGSRSLLHQMLVNPCINARDAMPNGGKLTVRAEVDRSDTTLSERPFIVVSFEDNGSGMDEATRAAVFEPFFTTKAEGRGTGLGLSTVQQVVEEHGGRIELLSELGRGTTLQLFLPASAVHTRNAQRVRTSERAGPREVVTDRPDADRARLILIVDDDELVGRSFRGALERLGYHTRTARDGSEAVLAYAQAPQPDLVLLDLDMPRADGATCLRQLRSLNPNARVLFVTGAPEGVLAKALEENEPDGVLRKPVDLRMLRESVAMAFTDRQSV
jgi:signal transduction histidine kinase/CheY-like chemotaxis protein